MVEPAAADKSDASAAAERAQPAAPATFDPAIFEYLLSRIEQLSRELGRAEGRQAAFERQIARLEQQLARLEREHGDQ